MSALRELFVDERGNGLRASWHPELGFAVISVWHDDTCTATFRLGSMDAGRLVGFLAGHLGEAASTVSTRQEQLMPDERHDSDLGGGPQPAGLNQAGEAGADMASPGGAVPGHPGPGGGGGEVGSGDLGGDADMGGGSAGTDEDPLRTETAGGEGAEDTPE